MMSLLNNVRNEELENSMLPIVSCCVEKVCLVVDRLLKINITDFSKTSAPAIVRQLNVAQETLEVRKCQLYLIGQCLVDNKSVPNEKLVNVAKKILQAALKVLIVMDSVDVRRCLIAVHIAEMRVKHACEASEPCDMLLAFKELKNCVLHMDTLLRQRCVDLVSQIQCNQLTSSMSTVCRLVSCLYMVIQICHKYPLNELGVTTKGEVLNNILSSLHEIQSTLENSVPEIAEDKPDHFVCHLDKVFSNLRKENRRALSEDFECWVTNIVCHAMNVANLCHDMYRQMIIHMCHRILQSKEHLFELLQRSSVSPHSFTMRVDYDMLCETLLDDFGQVEKLVNLAVLGFIVDTSCWTSELVDAVAMVVNDEREDIVQMVEQALLVDKVTIHGKRLCQIAVMAAAGCSDEKKARAVELAARRVGQLLHQDSRLNVQHQYTLGIGQMLNSLLTDVQVEFVALVHSLDTMMDPSAFLLLTVQRLCQYVKVLTSRLLPSQDVNGARDALWMISNHSQRMINVAACVVDNSCDPVYRNGIRVLVKHFEYAIQALNQAEIDLPVLVYDDKGVFDILHHDLYLLIDEASNLHQGIRGDNHIGYLDLAPAEGGQECVLSDRPFAVHHTANTGQQDKVNNVLHTVSASCNCMACMKSRIIDSPRDSSNQATFGTLFAQKTRCNYLRSVTCGTSSALRTSCAHPRSEICGTLSAPKTCCNYPRSETYGKLSDPRVSCNYLRSHICGTLSAPKTCCNYPRSETSGTLSDRRTSFNYLRSDICGILSAPKTCCNYPRSETSGTLSDPRTSFNYLRSDICGILSAPKTCCNYQRSETYRTLSDRRASCNYLRSDICGTLSALKTDCNYPRSESCQILSPISPTCLPFTSSTASTIFSLPAATLTSIPTNCPGVTTMCDAVASVPAIMITTFSAIDGHLIAPCHISTCSCLSTTFDSIASPVQRIFATSAGSTGNVLSLDDFKPHLFPAFCSKQPGEGSLMNNLKNSNGTKLASVSMYCLPMEDLSHHADVMATTSTFSSCQTPTTTSKIERVVSTSEAFSFNTSWSIEAQYRNEDDDHWHESDNYFVHLVCDMVRHCQKMSDFARRGNSLNDLSERAKSGLALARAGKELEKFARSIVSMAVTGSPTDELQNAADVISNYANQLHVLSMVKENSSPSPKGDCILVRNAANLVEAVRAMFSVCESTSIAMALKPRKGFSVDVQVLDLLGLWQSKLAEYQTNQMHTSQVDDLGLRRMERHKPPTLSSLLNSVR